MNGELRTDGTLGVAPAASLNWNWSASGPLIGAVEQFGNRSDWTALWGVNGTAFGLTRDGTLWIWGIDLGREAVATATTRIQLMKAAIRSGAAIRFLWDSGGLPPPILAEPRPLMKFSVK
jgi:hypothetical protein